MYKRPFKISIEEPYVRYNLGGLLHLLNQNKLGKIDQVSESQMYAAQNELKYFLREYLYFNENSFLPNI
jgi:hypothetical protein